MATVTVNWNEPTTRTDGSALPLSAIAGTNVSYSSDNGATFTFLASVPPGATNQITKDLTPGTYIFRLAVVDKQVPPKTGANVDKSAVVSNPSLAAPGIVTNVTVVIS